MQRILITGARGQIGTDLSVELKKDDDLHVLCTDLKPPEHAPINGLPAEDILLDVTSRDAMRDLITRYEIDMIFHLASLLSARGEQKPDVAWDVNLGGLRNVLELSRQNYAIEACSNTLVGALKVLKRLFVDTLAVEQVSQSEA